MGERKVRFCGWGFEGEGLSPAEEKMVLKRYADRFEVAGFDEPSDRPAGCFVHGRQGRRETLRVFEVAEGDERLFGVGRGGLLDVDFHA